MTHPIVMFDGVCNLCNASVLFILKNEKGPHLMFVPLQSESAAALIDKNGGIPPGKDSILFLEKGKIYSESTAALKIAGYLKWPWGLLNAGKIFPKFIRDGIYRMVARNRYRWFGVKSECMVPTPGLKSRFLEYKTNQV